ncbi:MAG: UDP-N-acetylglucosamine 1-carboxyvinyltransferase [Oscillospiraceae bacterium]|jgi:UDP-N-acetylglucosamine 1-carboxyvinyltransferase|nr:UDP-N-acetylglucosamine 1-carboxyvinyltransferase [Oscillospiraceae bacterium]
MEILRINGGNKLEGTARVQGAKNSVLPIMAASLLARGTTVIHNCPRLSDVDAAVKILTHLGCGITREGGRVIINSSSVTRCDIPHELMREMRSSVIFLGAVLARCGEAVLSMPGGCELGPRPVDLHIEALRSLGAEITRDGGNISCRAAKMKGCRVNLDFPSVGATENTMLFAACCDGATVITNAAREPEIWDLQSYLTRLGYRVHGAGTPEVTVEGAAVSGDTEHSVIPDRVVAATYLAAAACTGGDIEITGVVPGHLAAAADALAGMGCRVTGSCDSVRIDASTPRRAIRPVVTRPYPGFPTDAQPPIMAACLRAEGTTVFVENIFENRYRHTDEMKRLGADIRIEGRVAMVTGVKRLRGAPVVSTDLRGGASLVLAALMAEGVTEVSGVRHIDRGYDDLAGVLRSLGAEVSRTRIADMTGFE